MCRSEYQLLKCSLPWASFTIVLTIDFQYKLKMFFPYWDFFTKYFASLTSQVCLFLFVLPLNRVGIGEKGKPTGQMGATLAHGPYRCC